MAQTYPYKGLMFCHFRRYFSKHWHCASAMKSRIPLKKVNFISSLQIAIDQLSLKMLFHTNYFSNCLIFLNTENIFQNTNRADTDNTRKLCYWWPLFESLYSVQGLRKLSHVLVFGLAWVRRLFEVSHFFADSLAMCLVPFGPRTFWWCQSSRMGLAVWSKSDKRLLSSSNSLLACSIQVDVMVP